MIFHACRFDKDLVLNSEQPVETLMKVRSLRFRSLVTSNRDAEIHARGFQGWVLAWSRLGKLSQVKPREGRNDELCEYPLGCVMSIDQTCKCVT
jgi:hypothetical protein